MSPSPRIPSFRCLDIYRLAIVRQFKKQDIAASFGVSPSRISQVLCRVRRWVNDSVGHWFMPHRHELRFYVALEIEKIRVHESDDDPENVVIEGLGWRYSRQNRAPDAGQMNPDLTTQPDAAAGGQLAGHLDTHLSCHPINSAAQPCSDQSALSQGPAEASVTPATLELGHRLAQLLTLWQKSKKLTTARKSPASGNSPR